jgi:hypothetical protein
MSRTAFHFVLLSIAAVCFDHSGFIPIEIGRGESGFGGYNFSTPGNYLRNPCVMLFDRRTPMEA